MLIIHKGYPERSDLLVCTVTKIQFNSIFVRLDEYTGRQGIIHISEISPGRIRNIRDYVKEGKVIVCVVLRVNTERDLIELSLRRVQEGQRRKKINQMKQEQKAAKLIEFVAKAQKKDVKELTQHIILKIKNEYDTVHAYFEDIIMGGADLDLLELDADTTKGLLETIQQRIKPPEVFIKGRMTLQSLEPNGIEILKETLKKAQEVGGDKLSIIYLGAGKYDLSLTDEDYKSAEKHLKKITEAVETHITKKKGKFSFERTDR